MGEVLVLRDFAKVFQSSAGQILVFVGEDSDGLPCISLAAHSEHGPHVKMNIGGWNDSEDGWAKAFAALDMFDMQAAENFASKVLPDLLVGIDSKMVEG